MRRPILADVEQTLLADERRSLSALREALGHLDASADSVAALAQSIEQLDELFLVVIVGEFNSGKSAFINALLGASVLKEGVTPTTVQVNVLQFGPEPARHERSPHLHVISAPVDLLREIHIVDTPGTNAVIREHEAITAEFVPRSDLVLFVTSADRPFTESERLFLDGVREWGKKILVVINKVDLFDTPAQLEEVRSFVAEQGRRLLGTEPEIFPVSARLAQRAKAGDPAAWAPSGFERLETYIRDRLDEHERVRLKLANPLGVGLTLTRRYLDVVGGRLNLLAEDVQLLDDVDRQLSVQREDMDRQFDLRTAEIEKTLIEMEARGHAYFDEVLRVGRLFDLFNTARVQEGFERQVVSDTPREIERLVGEMIDWLVDADFRQWQQVTAHLADRRRQHRERIVGDPEVATFHIERTRLIDSVGREAQRVVDSYDRNREAAALAESARNAVATAAAVGAGALGLGAVVTLVATTAAADVTGVLLAGVLGTLGLFLIPARRRKAKSELRSKITAMRETLSRALRTQFERELRRSSDRLAESIAPYSRFVRAEQQSLTATRDRLATLQNEMTMLLGRVNAIGR
jgi:small GTP-binding protein